MIEASGDPVFAAALELRAALEKTVAWLDRLTANSEVEEKKYRGQWDSLADNAKADAKNWRATADDLRKTIKRANVRLDAAHEAMNED
jgi:hypothetical protein